MIRIMKIGEVSPEEIFARISPETDVQAVVSDIIADVRENGDKALYAYAKKFDKADLKSLQVSADELEEAFGSVEPEFLDVLKEAAENIRAFHSRQVRNSFIINDKPGIVMGQ